MANVEQCGAVGDFQERGHGILGMVPVSHPTAGHLLTVMTAGRRPNVQLHVMDHMPMIVDIA
ncbi:hypothetical protein ASG92_16665 [Arthrobacter sp. Soil736]|nr:hypothetical protein ASG92_16665 [Arthrobacter sp. Soil736]